MQPNQVTQFPAYVRLVNIFQLGELQHLVKEALQAAPEGGSNTRDIAAYILKAKAGDAADRALAVSVEP